MLNKDNLVQALDDVRVKTYDIPFGHSLYQTEKFILNEPGSKGRLLRQRQKMHRMKRLQQKDLPSDFERNLEVLPLKGKGLLQLRRLTICEKV